MEPSTDVCLLQVNIDIINIGEEDANTDLLNKFIGNIQWCGSVQLDVDPGLDPGSAPWKKFIWTRIQPEIEKIQKKIPHKKIILKIMMMLCMSVIFILKIIFSNES